MRFTELYSEKDKIPTMEDFDFIKMAEKVVGWSPLTTDDRFYRNPWVKYTFYQDVLFEFDIFIKAAKDAGRYSRKTEILSPGISFIHEVHYLYFETLLM